MLVLVKASVGLLAVVFDWLTACKHQLLQDCSCQMQPILTVNFTEIRLSCLSHFT